MRYIFIVSHDWQIILPNIRAGEALARYGFPGRRLLTRTADGSALTTDSGHPFSTKRFGALL